MVDFLEVDHDSLVALIVYIDNHRYLVYASINSCSKRDSTDARVFQNEGGKVRLH